VVAVVGQSPQPAGQGGRGGGEQVGRLAYVAEHGGDPDGDPIGELGVGVAVTQMNRYEQGLPTAGQPPPWRPDAVTVGTQQVSHAVEVYGGDGERARIGH
jgi:hypothetical protein